jgi:hypothetical protein
MRLNASWSAAARVLFVVLEPDGLDPVEPLLRAQVEAGGEEGVQHVALADVEPALVGPALDGAALHRFGEVACVGPVGLP